jgi:2'-5' RNA ligase
MYHHDLGYGKDLRNGNDPWSGKFPPNGNDLRSGKNTPKGNEHPIGDEQRYFIAVPIPAEVKRTIRDWCERHRHMMPFKRWVHGDDYHITLQFLGNCGRETADEVRRKLADVTPKLASFDLTLTGIGCFGQREKPRVLWAGVGGDLDRLNRAQAAVVEAMRGLGFVPEERPFRPHVTLARQYEGGRFEEKRMAGRWSEEMASPKWSVTSIVLYRTRMGSQPMYVNEVEYDLMP